MSGDQNAVNCPLWDNCSDALSAGGNFTPGGVLSLTQTPSGVLFVLDADQEVLFQVSP